MIRFIFSNEVNSIWIQRKWVHELPTCMHPDVVDEASAPPELLGAVLAVVGRLARVDLAVLEERAVASGR